MPAAAPPPTTPPAIVSPAPECHIVSKAIAQRALDNISSVLRSTKFVSARPSQICGLVRLEMASGKVVYTDATGRFLLLTMAMDTHSGSPADTQEALDNALLERDTYPSGGIPGVLPPNKD